MDSDKITVIRYEPDPDDEPVVNPLAFFDGLGTGILFASVLWLTILVVLL